MESPNQIPSPNYIKQVALEIARGDFYSFVITFRTDSGWFMGNFIGIERQWEEEEGRIGRK